MPRRLLDRGLVGLCRHFAGQQHDAVVAGHVDMATVADRFANARRGPGLQTLVLDQRARGAAVGDHHAAGRRAADQQRRAATEGRRAWPQSRDRSGGRPRRQGGELGEVSWVFLFSEQLKVDRVAQAMQHQQMDFLDAGGALVRHADVHVGLGSGSRIWPPPWPVSAITVMSLARAASTAASTLAELPLVLMASSTSPGAPSAWTCLAKTAASRSRCRSR